MIFFSTVPTVAAAPSLYNQILHLSRRELMINDRGGTALELPVARFVAKGNLPAVDDAPPVEIDDLLGGGFLLCVERKLDPVYQCEQVRAAARALAAREEGTRTLGRDLQIIASGFEEAIAGNAALTVTERAIAIARMWRADGMPETGTDAGALRLRTQTVADDPDRRGEMEALGELLAAHAPTGQNGLTDESRLAAIVWRYRFGGQRWVDDSGAAENAGAGTERESLLRRWPDIEQLLESIRENLEEGEVYPPLRDGEAAMLLLPDEEQELLPENVRVWAYIEKTAEGVSADAGLSWVHALEPVLPTLCSGTGDDCDDAIRGGLYPPPPEDIAADESALCSHPLMRQGYLCSRPRGGDADICAERPAPDGDTVVIAACTEDAPERDAGPGGEIPSATAWQLNDDPTEDVCTPLQETSYANTIGNTVLFLNRCWLQSLRDHRVIPGRSPLHAGDGAFPFDACMRPDPQLGGILPSPSTAGEWVPPPYRPQQLLRDIEETLCPGLPPGNPLCLYDLDRNLDRSDDDLARFGYDLVGFGTEFRDVGQALRQMAEAVGIRVGTHLYDDFLARKSQALTDIAVTAAGALRQFTRAAFPTVMCPLNDDGGEGILGTPLCGAPASPADLPPSPAP